MSTVNKRLEKLEAKIAPPENILFIIKHKDESDAEAMARTGITSKDLEEATTVIRVIGV